MSLAIFTLFALELAAIVVVGNVIPVKDMKRVSITWYTTMMCGCVATGYSSLWAARDQPLFIDTTAIVWFGVVNIVLFALVTFIRFTRWASGH